MAKVVAAAVVVAVAASGGCGGAEAYAVGPSPLKRSGAGKVRYSPTVKHGHGIHKRRDDGSAVTLYLFPTPPSVSAASHQRSRRAAPGQPSPIRSSRSRTSTSPRSVGTSLPAMSYSVLAESDTLPSFHTAHGLLSPEVVMRIADTQDELEAGAPLHDFLKLYKSRGPMACLPMLSDPCVLPELTKAMREIA